MQLGEDNLILKELDRANSSTTLKLILPKLQEEEHTSISTDLDTTKSCTNLKQLLPNLQEEDEVTSISTDLDTTKSCTNLKQLLPKLQEEEHTSISTDLDTTKNSTNRNQIDQQEISTPTKDISLKKKQWNNSDRQSSPNLSKQQMENLHSIHQKGETFLKEEMVTPEGQSNKQEVIFCFASELSSKNQQGSLNVYVNVSVMALFVKEKAILLSLGLFLIVIHFFTQIFLDGSDYTYYYENLPWVFPTNSPRTNYDEFVYSLPEDDDLADVTFEELR